MIQIPSSNLTGKDNFIYFIERIKDTGWTFPPYVPINLITILGNGQDTTDLDLLFKLYYLGNGGYNFNYMNNKIISSSLDKSLIKAYKECIFAFEKDKFIIAANTLIIIIEGILSTFHADKTNLKMKLICPEQIKKFSEDDVKKLIWISYDNFINKLYENCSFNSNEPIPINRNWYLHGRSSFSLNKIDCLKLFNAVSTICFMHENIGKF